MLRTSKIALLALLIIGGSVLALPKPAQAGSGAPTQMVSEEPPLLVRFFSATEGQADYDVDINNQVRLVGNFGDYFVHIRVELSGEVYLERFQSVAQRTAWLNRTQLQLVKTITVLGLSF